MASSLTLPIAGTLGNDTGNDSIGVHVGTLTATAVTKGLLKSMGSAGLCYTDDGGLFTDETTAFNNATADDVEVLPAVPAADDAVYIGHATAKYARVDVNITTQGDWVGTGTWQYWNGTAWTALSAVVDGTTNLSATTGWKSVTFTEPVDWATNTVDSVVGYWIRYNITAHTSIATPQQWGQGVILTTAAVYTDDTTDINDADANDVAMLPAITAVGDAFIFLQDEKFCAIKVTVGTARTGTLTIAPHYWNGTAITALPAGTWDDDSTGFSAGTSSYLIHFVPPADWVTHTALNGPAGNTGFAIYMVVTAYTSMTAQPLVTQAWVYPLVTGAAGVAMPFNTGTFTVTGFARTRSGSTADSVFLFINATTGRSGMFTWTKTMARDEETTVAVEMAVGDNLVVKQITEDGTTELANATLVLTQS